MGYLAAKGIFWQQPSRNDCKLFFEIFIVCTLYQIRVSNADFMIL